MIMLINETIDGVKVSGDIDKMHPDEIKAYIARGKEQHPDVKSIRIKIDGDEVELRYFGPVEQGIPFDRIRRISGYLVGTTDRWNDGKIAELKDRVKHGGI